MMCGTGVGETMVSLRVETLEDMIRPSFAAYRLSLLFFCRQPQRS